MAWLPLHPATTSLAEEVRGRGKGVIVPVGIMQILTLPLLPTDQPGPPDVTLHRHRAPGELCGSYFPDVGRRSSSVW